MGSDDMPDSAFHAAHAALGNVQLVSVLTHENVELLARAMHAYAKAFAADSIREEQEACAMIADNMACAANNHSWLVCQRAISEAIRARGKETGNG